MGPSWYIYRPKLTAESKLSLRQSLELSWTPTRQRRESREIRGPPQVESKDNTPEMGFSATEVGTATRQQFIAVFYLYYLKSNLAFWQSSELSLKSLRSFCFSQYFQLVWNFGLIKNRLGVLFFKRTCSFRLSLSDHVINRFLLLT